jgi:hypothetical protein
MDINVQAGEAPPGQPVDAGPVAAVPGSPLINLRAQRQTKLDQLHLDLEVPRWGDVEGGAAVWVRYRPVNQTKALQALERRQQSKDKAWVELANADQLIQACIGVYTKVNGQPFTLASDGSGNWISFDPDKAPPREWVSFSGERAPELANALGIDLSSEASKAVALVRAVYFTNGDMNLACQELALWSSQVAPKADEEALGE